MNDKIVINASENEVDILQLFKVLWRRGWIILLSMIVCGAIIFVGAIITVKPKYTSTAMMYVNNNSISVGSGTVTFSSSQLSAARSLLQVYVIILRSQTTIEAVMEKAGLDDQYTYREVRSMVSAGSVDGTEIFSISATCEDRETAELIVDTIVEILPGRIAEIVEGSSVKLVDEGRRPVAPSSPSYTRYAVTGMAIGAFISSMAIMASEMLNGSIRDDEYLKKRYNLPVLALIPEETPNSKDEGAYAYRYGGSGAYENSAAVRGR